MKILRKQSKITQNKFHLFKIEWLIQKTFHTNLYFMHILLFEIATFVIYSRLKKKFTSNRKSLWFKCCDRFIETNFPFRFLIEMVNQACAFKSTRFDTYDHGYSQDLKRNLQTVFTFISRSEIDKNSSSLFINCVQDKQ